MTIPLRIIGATLFPFRWSFVGEDLGRVTGSSAGCFSAEDSSEGGKVSFDKRVFLLHFFQTMTDVAVQITLNKENPQKVNIESIDMRNVFKRFVWNLIYRLYNISMTVHR